MSHLYLEVPGRSNLLFLIVTHSSTHCAFPTGSPTLGQWECSWSHSHPQSTCFFHPFGSLMLEIPGLVKAKSREKVASGISGWVLPIPWLLAHSPQPPETGMLTVLLWNHLYIVKCFAYDGVIFIQGRGHLKDPRVAFLSVFLSLQRNQPRASTSELREGHMSVIWQTYGTGEVRWQGLSEESWSHLGGGEGLRRADIGMWSGTGHRVQHMRAKWVLRAPMREQLRTGEVSCHGRQMNVRSLENHNSSLFLPKGVPTGSSLNIL